MLVGSCWTGDRLVARDVNTTYRPSPERSGTVEKRSPLTPASLTSFRALFTKVHVTRSEAPSSIADGGEPFEHVADCRPQPNRALSFSEIEYVPGLAIRVRDAGSG